jgi:glutaminyl-peptide cyclotransferase
MLMRLRNYSVEIVLILVLLAAVGFFAYLGYGLLPTTFVQEFSGDRAYANAEQQLGFGNRRTGSEESKRTGDWLAAELIKSNWVVLIQPFSAADNTTGRNIIAYRTHQAAGAPTFLLGAHYDSRLVASADPNPANQTLPTAGANSGASGAALLLELARTLNINATGHTVCLVFFDADDNGELPNWQPHMGSSYFVKQLKTQEQLATCSEPRFALLVDMVGNVQQQLMLEQSSDPELSTMLLETATTLGYASRFNTTTRPAQVGAHLPFIEAQIPTVMLADYNYRYRYMLEDTVDKLDAASFKAVGHTLEAWLENEVKAVTSNQ